MPAAILHCLEAHATSIGDRIALKHADTEVSYSTLCHCASLIRKELSNAGLKEWALVRLNIVDSDWCAAMVGYLGVISAGMVAVLSNAKEDLPGYNLPSLSLAGAVPFTYRIDFGDLDNRDATSLGRQYFSQPLDIVFSSGSTGQRKAFLFAHSHFIDEAGIRSPRHEVRAAHVGVPFHTSTGVHGIALRHFIGGLTSVQIDPPNDWPELLAALRSMRPYELSTTPFTMEKLLAKETSLRKEDCLRILRVYAGSLSDALRAKLSQALSQCRIVSIYGLTEAGSGSLIRDKYGATFEKAQRNTSFRVWRDDESRWAVDGEEGEILAHVPNEEGPPVNLDSTGQPDDIPSCWVRTGDIGYHDDDGAIVFLGRSKDLIVINGERRSAAKVEESFAKLPQLGAVMFFNVVRSDLEELAAIVETTLSKEELSECTELRMISKHLVVVLVDAISRTSLGKIARYNNIMKISENISTSSGWSVSAEGDCGSFELFDLREKRRN